MQPWITPQRFTSRVQRQSLSGSSQSGTSSWAPTPALLQRRCTRPVRLDGPALERLHGLVARDVDDDAGRLGAAGAELLDRGRERRRFDVGDHDPHACAGEARDDRAPDAARTAGHDGGLAGELTHARRRGRHRREHRRDVVVALVDVGHERRRGNAGQHRAAAPAPALLVRHRDETAHRQVGDRIEHRLAEDHLAGDVLDLLERVLPREPDEQRVELEALPLLERGEALVAVRVLGEPTRAPTGAAPATDLEIRDAVTRDRRPDRLVGPLELDLRELLRLAEGLTPADDGALGRHRHGDHVKALDALVDRARAEDGGADLDVEPRGHVDLDLGDGDADLGSLSRSQRRRQDGRDQLGVGLVAGADLAGRARQELGVELGRETELVGGLHVTELAHRFPPFGGQAANAAFGGPIRATNGASASTSKP